MEFNFLVFDENSVIAGFKYFEDALHFVYTLIPDFNSEVLGYDIFDTIKGKVIEYKTIRDEFLKLPTIIRDKSVKITTDCAEM